MWIVGIGGCCIIRFTVFGKMIRIDGGGGHGGAGADESAGDGRIVPRATMMPGE